jgi:hypothetical protein
VEQQSETDAACSMVAGAGCATDCSCGGER